MPNTSARLPKSAAPPAVLGYLLYRQSRAANPKALDQEAAQALTLIDCASAGDTAAALVRGWLSHNAPVKQAWLLPLVFALADDRLAPLARQRIEEWGPTSRRALAAQLLRGLAQMESQAAHAEISAIYKLFKRGYMRRAAKEALTLAQAN